MKHRNYTKSSGFTLVELSIVLVIIGLIVGGITAGASMIRAAQVKNVMKEFNGYLTAINIFRDKYDALPGDITNATAYWSGTADGNGDGIINLSNEAYRSWQHLSLAGLITGTYTGTHTSSASVLGVNTPASKVVPGGWGFYNGLAPWSISIPERNNMCFGGALSTNVPVNANVLTPAETYDIDMKFDNGIANTGKIITNATNCASGATYTLTTTGKTCAFMINTGK